MLEQGVAKEVARTVLPLATYTKYYWSCNPRSLMHFCSLRNHEAAQFEIRQYARGRGEFLERLMPVTHAAFVANDRIRAVAVRAVSCALTRERDRAVEQPAGRCLARAHGDVTTQRS